MEPCKFFAKGNCTRGSSCIYPHFATEKIQEPCKFFERGHCDRGSACFYLHLGDQALNGGAASFQPIPATLPHGTIGSSLMICRYFAKGFCKDGESCRFVHSLDSEAYDESEATHRTSSSTFTRSLNGAQVSYGSGAQVTGVELYTDFSAVQITGLGLNSRIDVLQLLLSDLGFTIPMHNFQAKISQKDRAIVEVKMKDPGFAKSLIDKFNEEVVKDYGQEIDIKEIPISSSNGSSAVSRLRTTSLLCSWPKASCTAWLCYRDPGAAMQALDRLSAHGKIMFRRILLSIDYPQNLPTTRRFTMTIKVANLDPLTRPIHFTSLLQ